MSRLTVPSLADSPAASKQILGAVQKQLGLVPNLFRLIGTSPAALEGFSANNAALGKTLDLRSREAIALAVGQVNGCDYCLSAHTYLALNLAKVSSQEVALNRKAVSGDPRVDAAVRFAAEVVRERGHITDADLRAVRAAGFSDAHIVEIVAVAAENCFTNFLNEVAKTDIDFPVIRSAEAA